MEPTNLFTNTTKLIAENDALKAANFELKAKINDVPIKKIIKYAAIGAVATLAGVWLYRIYQEQNSEK